MDVRKIRIEDFDYPLPEERIALHPLAQRDSCKLIAAGAEGKISHHIFSRLPMLIKPGTLIVANETKVIRARLEFIKETGAKIEIFLLEPLKPHDYATNFASTGGCSWICMVGNKKRWKEGSLTKEIEIEGKKVELRATEDKEDGGIAFSWSDRAYSFAEIIEAAGNIPIPPYLKRKSEDSDAEDYQTVYSKTEGSVAAPTAGLHFTPELIEELRRSGDEFATVTLHVGAGTFQPVKSEEIGEHPMHNEWISVGRKTITCLIDALENGRDILAVGTTSVRTLESLPYLGVMLEEGKDGGETGAMRVEQWMPYEERYRRIDTLGTLKSIRDYLSRHDLESLEANTSIMIAPGFRWRIVNRLITNFHQPKSTLLLLVSSFLGGGRRWREIYDEALEKDYRFLSYGDACLFSRGPQSVQLPLSKSMLLRQATVFARQNPEKLDEMQSWRECDDVDYYVKALKKTIKSAEEDSREEIYIGEGAAPLRFLTAFAASYPGAKVKITCAEGLRRRPIRPLISALKKMGAEIEFTDDPDDWAITIDGRLLDGDKVEVEGNITSQYVSALMLALPGWRHKEAGVSRPYVRMTEKMIENPEVAIEADWSAAAFFYEYAYVMKKNVTVSSLTPPAESLQGDAACCDIFSMTGVNTEFRKSDGETGREALLRYDADAVAMIREEEREIEYDFTDTPDLVPAVAVALCHGRVPFRLHGVGTLRYKESDRLGGLIRILTRLGYEIETDGNALEFNGEFRPMEEFPIEIDINGDHRMAMAFYPLELAGMVSIEDKSVVSKSFPNFYQQF